MISFSDGLKHLYVIGLNEIGPNISFSLNDWLTQASEYIIFQDLLLNNFSIQTYDAHDFLKPYAFDINRLSCASLESLRDVEVKEWQPKFIGWNITKLYYSAFFAVHSILKITGNSISNIEKTSLESVRRRARAYNFTYQNLNTGLYCLKIDQRNNTFQFFKNAIYDNSHEGLWKCFLDFINTIIPTVYNQLPQSEAQLVVEKLEELKAAICEWDSSSGNWLSRIRNLVNYGQKFGSWFPYKESSKEYEKLYDYLPLVNTDPLDIDIKSYRGKDILYFSRTCILINAINLTLLNDISSRHPTNKSFVMNGIHKFQNLYP